MKHASATALDQLEALLSRLRQLSQDKLKEKKRGIFYYKSRAFLHFHEDPTGLYADVRLNGDVFERFEVTTLAQQEAFIERLVATFDPH